MSKKIRPGRVFADPHANAFIVEYIVETLNDENGQVRGSSRHSFSTISSFVFKFNLTLIPL
jgi:hypothetical protein